VQEIIFYNGFNLLIDIVLCFTVGFFAYRSGKISGYLKGYGEGQADYHEHAEHAGQYWLDSERENA